MSRFERYITTSGRYNRGTSEYRQSILTNMVLALCFLDLVLSAVINYLVGLNFLVLVDTAGAIASIGIIVYLHRTKKLRVASVLTLALVVILLDLFLLEVGHQFYSFYILCIIFPLAYFLLGTRLGTVFSTIFILYHLIIINRYYEEWEPAVFQQNSLINLAIGSTVLMALLYFYEYSRADAFKQLEAKNVALQKLSLTDFLTGLDNRRSYYIEAQRELNIATRLDKCFYFAVLDIDQFKAFNDKYGHLEGDKVLIELGKTLRSTLKRGTDRAYRMGGEEFAIIGISESGDTAIELIEGVRKLIENLNIEHSNNPPYGRVTVSVGLAIIKPSSKTTIDEVYKLADEMLYRAKAAGRNRVELRAPI